MGFEVDTYMDDMLEDSINEELEHTILDKILQEWDDDMVMEEGVRKDLQEKEARQPGRRLMDDMDECLDTIFCEGDCQHIFPKTCKTSTTEWSRGENITNRDRNVTTSSAEQVGRGDNIGSNILPINVKQKMSSKNIFSLETLSDTELQPKI